MYFTRLTIYFYIFYKLIRLVYKCEDADYIENTVKRQRLCFHNFECSMHDFEKNLIPDLLQLQSDEF